MERQPVESSVLKSVGYDTENRILELEFRVHGEVWQYYGVDKAIYQEFIHADSLGRYFVKQIKGNYLERRVA